MYGRSGRTLRIGGSMPKDPNYYDILGLQPGADAAAVDAAYRGRSLRFRVGQPRTRGAEQTGPTQEQIEQAYAILGDPESRARYDAVYFPTKQPSPKGRRRIPAWLWALAGFWVVALVVVLLVGVRSRTQGDGGAIGKIAGTTVTIVAPGGGRSTVTVSPSSGATLGGSPTVVAALPPSTTGGTVIGTPPPIAAVATATAIVVPTLAPSATPTSPPTATVGPTSTATSSPPTAPIAPTATAVLPIAEAPTAAPAPEPEPEPTVAPEPEPEPTATPSFRATDWIGTSLSVNLRSGPGAAYPSLGLLPTGTLLRATGEKVVVAGQLWRRFLLPDGRVGWVRDLDVFSAR
jgi:hypothetical protein